MPSSYYSEQPEFGTDPYSYIIGQPLPKPNHHGPMESWSNSHYHPSYGTSTIENYDWRRSSYGVPFGKFDEEGVYRLSITYVDSGTGSVEDVHTRYFLGGTLLERVKQDFERYVIGSWQTARRYDKEFPHHTIVKLSRVLDPTRDSQPDSMDTTGYIEVKDSDIRGYAAMCLFSTQTPKRTSSFQGKIYYFSDGRVGRAESYITRNSYRDFVVKTFVGGIDDTEQVEYIYDSKYGVIYEIDKAERRRLMTEKSRWEKRQRELLDRFERQRKREEKAKAVAKEKAERAIVAQKKKSESERVNQYIVDHYNDCSQPAMAKALGISTKAVEHRVSRLRQKGLIPIARGSNIYIDQSKREEEERLKREKKLRQAEERAEARRKKQQEEQARKDAVIRERKERSKRIDQYIIENYREYTYKSIAKELGISSGTVGESVKRLRREGRIPYSDPYDNSFAIGRYKYAGKSHKPPPFSG